MGRSQSLVACLVCGLLAGCGAVSPPASTLSLSPNDWNLRFCHGVPDHPAATGGSAVWYFDFPSGEGSGVDYVTTPYHPTQDIQGKTLSMTFKVVSNAPIYGLSDPATYPPIALHLYLERSGDDGTGNGEMQYYRWWCPSGYYNLGSADNTEVTIFCRLSSESWTSVRGATDAAEFQQTLRSLQWIGFTFGGSAGWGHGVNLQSGTARFELIDFSVQ